MASFTSALRIGATAAAAFLQQTASVTSLSRIGAILALVSSVTLSASVCYAAPSYSKWQLAHAAPFPEDEIPPVGLPITLSVQVVGSKDISPQMRAYVITDGVLSVIPPTEVKFNDYDYPQYDFETYSPRTGMRYWFELEAPASASTSEANADNSGEAETGSETEDENADILNYEQLPLVSKYFEVQRSCLPRPGLTTRERDGSLEDQEPLATLVLRSRELEHERFAYDEAIALLQTLFKELDGMGGKS